MAEHASFVYPPNTGETNDWAFFVDAEVAMTNGSRQRATDLGQRFIDSPYGHHMAGQPYRFPNHSYDRQHMLADLGPDVDPLGHQIIVSSYIGWLIKAELDNPSPSSTSKDIAHITPEELGILRFVGLNHDNGEATHPALADRLGQTVGDIPFGQKTGQNHLIERRVRHEFYIELFPDVSRLALGRVEDIISHEDTTLLHSIYAAAHDLSGFDTGKRAERAAKRKLQQADSPETLAEASMLLELSIMVAETMAPKILEWSKLFVLVRQHLHLAAV